MKNSIFKEMFLYLIVGAIATVVEWVSFYIFADELMFHYLFSTIYAYTISTFSNWLLGRLIVFKASKVGFIHEIMSIYVVSIIGLVLNLLIMWVLVELKDFNEILAKIIATVIVFAWNFIIRKVYIYRKPN